MPDKLSVAERKYICDLLRLRVRALEDTAEPEVPQEHEAAVRLLEKLARWEITC